MLDRNKKSLEPGLQELFPEDQMYIERDPENPAATVGGNDYQSQGFCVLSL